MVSSDKDDAYVHRNYSRRLLLAALIPLLAVCLQWFFWESIQPFVWLLLYPAVFFSSQLGGKWVGIGATAFSTLAAWWLFIPDRFTFALERPMSAVAMGIFFAMGILFSLVHERLQTATQTAAAALEASNEARAQLEQGISRESEHLALAVDALRESEAKYRRTLDSMLEGCQIVGFDWRYLYLNDAAEKHNRRPNVELLGRPVQECWPGIEETQAFAMEKLAMEQRTTQKFETEFVFPDGFRGWYRVIIQPAQEGIVIFSDDVTERKLAELEVKEQESLLRLILETLPVGVWIVDANGVIVQGNRTGKKIWEGARYVGIDQYDVYKGWWSGTGRRIQPHEWAAARAVTQGETSLDEEVDIECFDGSRKTILHCAVPLRDAGGRITGAVVINQDITRRKQAEDFLQQSENAFRALFEQAAVGMAQLSPDGRWLQVNQLLCDLLGYTRDELLALTFQKITHPDDLTADISCRRQLLDGELNTCAIEKRYIRRDGTTVWVNLTIGLVHKPDGAPDYFIAVVENITKRKLAEAALSEKQHLLEELNKSLEQRVNDAVLNLRRKDQILIQQSRQAAMGEMIGNIAHQWRQPLNTLGLIVQELLMTYGSREFTAETLESNVRKAMELISHMSKTIDDFSTFFKPEKDKSVFNINQAVAKTLSLVAPTMKNLEIRVDVVEKEQADILGYSNEYSQVLLNILTNCRDAFQEREREGPRIITITLFKEDGMSVVTVADNAGGIEESILNKIFDPYFTTKGPDKGTGIGLYMAKTIIEKTMGGRLSVRNTEVGAEFRIEARAT